MGDNHTASRLLDQIDSAVAEAQRSNNLGAEVELLRLKFDVMHARKAGCVE